MNQLFSLRNIFLVFIFILMISCNAVTSNSSEKNNPGIQTSLNEWQNQKFSMFIHWGLYSIPAGVWKGEKIKGYSEQIKGHAKIPTKEYNKLAGMFNPVYWNPDSVVILAKEAGMKSIVITSKHHDGFSMFGTMYSGFNVVDATPYRRDVIKELSEACRRHGLAFGVYFSLIDWNFPGAMPFTSTRNSDSIPPLHHQYNLNQVEELLTNYGKISEIWFDMGSPTFEQSKEIAELVKKLQPDCLISGRLWNDQGDFIVMGDNFHPDFKMGVPWQTPASMFRETWSYRSWQERGDVNEKIREKIHDLVKIVSMGGNYLLNIGPTAEGVVIPFEKEVLKGIGRWLRDNGEAVYGTDVSPVRKQDWGVITSKPGRLYLHILNYPGNKKLVLKGFSSDVKKIYQLSDKDIKLEGKTVNGDLEIELDENIPVNEFSTVLVVEYEGELSYKPDNIVEPDKKGTFILTPDKAEKYHSFSGHDYYSNRPTVIKLKWNLVVNKEGKCKIAVTGKAQEELTLSVNGRKYPISFVVKKSSAESDSNFIEMEEVMLTPGAVNSIELSRKDQSNPHKGINFGDLCLKLRMNQNY